MIDIAGLKSDRYRLRATAHPANWFAETNNTNNSTWVDSGPPAPVSGMWPTGRPPDIPVYRPS